MINGMEREQFLQYRMSLLPASGFQSAQYRMIEFYSTPMENLVHHTVRSKFSSQSTQEELYDNIYWKKGATNAKTGEKTLTLKQFEYRYTPRFIRITNEVKNATLYHRYLQLPPRARESEELIKALRNFDVSANVNWPLMHQGAAYKYLKREKDAVKATGGTNWREYLPPSFQKIIFFPELWSREEKKNWGQQWVKHRFNPEKVD